MKSLDDLVITSLGSYQFQLMKSLVEIESLKFKLAKLEEELKKPPSNDKP